MTTSKLVSFLKRVRETECVLTQIYVVKDNMHMPNKNLLSMWPFLIADFFVMIIMIIMIYDNNDLR